MAIEGLAGREEGNGTERTRTFVERGTVCHFIANHCDNNTSMMLQ